jgi:hypothetical protein
MAICFLCGEEKKLIKAHIYPEWVFRSLYPGGKVDNDHPLVTVSAKQTYAKRKPIGIWDENILCNICDEYLGREFDAKGKIYLLDRELNLAMQSDKGLVFVLSGVDPIILKNFLLSLLLRASWSETDEFRGVSLPTKFLERIKEIIKNNSETSLSEFGIFITRFKAGRFKEVAMKYSQVLYQTRINSINYYVLNLPNGYKVYIKVDSRDDMDAFTGLALRANYPVHILQWESFEDSRELKMLIPHLGKIKPYDSG